MTATSTMTLPAVIDLMTTSDSSTPSVLATAPMKSVRKVEGKLSISASANVITTLSKTKVSVKLLAARKQYRESLADAFHRYF